MTNKHRRRNALLHLCILVCVRVISAEAKHTSLNGFLAFLSRSVRVLNLVPTKSCFISVAADPAKHFGGLSLLGFLTVLTVCTSARQGQHGLS